MVASTDRILSFLACFTILFISSSFADSPDGTRLLPESFSIAQAGVPGDSIDESQSTQNDEKPDNTNIDQENSVKVYLDISSYYHD